MGRSCTVLGALLGAMVVVGAAPATRSASQFQVVYERIDASGNADVVVTNEDGKPQKNLTADSASDESSPAFSPDGKSVVFTSNRGGRFALWIMNADGTKVHTLTPAGGSDVNPSYSPDGKWIAFACNVHGNWDICVVTSAGTSRRNLTADAAMELDPSWSPDSKQIVFDRIVGHKSDIWTIGPKGGTMLDITPGTSLAELDPALSKSGQLAFDAMDPKGNYDIYVTKPRSTQATRLTTDPAEDSVPVYSPDGTKLLFVSTRTGDYDVFEMNADGSGQRDVSRSQSTADVAPNWGPATAKARALATVSRPARAAGPFPCALFGTTGNDNGVDHPVINGNGNANRICALSGKDIAHGWDENDLIDGGPGNDTLFGDGCAGTTGNPPHTCGDTIYARAGVTPDSDTIVGGTGSDTAFVDPTIDTCKADVEHCRTPS